MTNNRYIDPDEARDDVPELTGDFRDMAEQFMQLLREADEQTALLDAAEAEAIAESDQRRAEQARAGALGPDWRVVQGRIDLGQTTLEAVFSGADASQEAERLRGVAAKNLDELRETWSEEKDDDEDAPPTPDDVFEQTVRDSRARFEHAAARIDDALRAARRQEEGDDV